MFFFRKSKIAARGHAKIVTYEEFSTYSFVITLFHLFFTRNSFQGFFLSFKASFVFCSQKSKNGRLIQY